MNVASGVRRMGRLVSVAAALGCGSAWAADTVQAGGAARDWRSELVTPDPHYSQMPFWFWNDDLSDEEIVRQMADFRAHGVYGFVIHARIGLPGSVGYMSARWMQHVRTAVEEAARTNMRVCLYDEGMYPSGSAHGEVAKSNPAYVAHGLAAEIREIAGPAEVTIAAPTSGQLVATFLAKTAERRNSIDPGSIRQVNASENPVKVEAGNWRLITLTFVPSEGRIRGVHEEEDDHQPKAPLAADLLNPEAMQAFIRLAYQPYYDALKPHFGKTVLAMFTDEPSILGRAPRRGLQPWTPGFEKYMSEHGVGLETLPALFCDIGPATGETRAQFRALLDKRLNETYYAPLGAWCAAHGIALTGHPAGANDIDTLRHFQIPGQDLVWRGVVPEGPTVLEKPNSALAKCSSSVARHDGRARNSDELYGAYGWQLTMEEMKWIADWMMVRGVDLLYPHAFYYSVRENRGMERPPDLGPNNAWWPHYKPLADYTARICGLVARGQQVCETAILCRNGDLPWRAAKVLYQSQVDFNYLEEWRLLEQTSVRDRRLIAGPMSYATLIVDRDGPVEATVEKRLEEIAAAGVKVVRWNASPDAGRLAGLTRVVEAEAGTTDLRAARYDRDGRSFFFLVNEGPREIIMLLRVPLTGRAEWFDAWTGRFKPAAGIEQAGGLRLPLLLERRESVVLCVDPKERFESESAKDGPKLQWKPLVEIGTGWTVTKPDGTRIEQAVLGDWLKQESTHDYVGTLRYAVKFKIDVKGAAARYKIDLGEVGDFATASVNGKSLPVRFWAPYAWDVTDLVHAGENELAVEVTNSLVNRYDAKIRRASGLMGPVLLILGVP